ncbi:MAG: DUF480 domain-containing protein [Ilumatobacteraceae bacterium]
MLSIVEGRVIGCLLEKERTTPDQYPLSANALASACNQSTAREPVMHLDEHEVLAALDSLKAGGLVRFVHPSHGRSVTRYRQVFDERHALEPPGAALLCLLLLRGAQTAAELHARSGRLHELGSAADAEAALHDLARHELVRLLDRQPGQSAQRWQQLVAEEAEIVRTAAVVSAPSGGLAERVAELEARVARLESALSDLL